MIERGWLVGLMLLLPACSASAGDDGAGGGGASNGGTTSSGGGGGTTSGGSTGTGAGFGFGGSGAGGSTGGAAGTPAGGGSAGSGGNACTPPSDTPGPEVCGNGLDDDLNGFVDEGCVCTIGQTQPCFGGPPSQTSLPNCTKGSQSCLKSGEFGQWGPCQGWSCGPATPPPEICGNGVDEDCDGVPDDGCSLNVPVDINGDCLAAFCPPQAPYPVGCNINMQGGDSRGCVANAPGNPGVYFQEGDQCPNPLCPWCDAGHITGTLLCSSQPPTAPLNATNCPINKPDKFYPTDPSGCP